MTREQLLHAPLAELVDGRGPAPRRAPRQPGHLLAEGLHPADDAVPGPLRLLHVRQAAGPPRPPVPPARRGPGDRPGRCRARAVTRRSSRSAKAPRTATPSPRSGSPPTATRRRSTTSSTACRAVLEETGLLPHANAGALEPGGPRAAPGGQPVAGDDARVARRPAPRAGRAALRRAGQDRERDGWRRSRPRAGRASRSPPGILVGFGETPEERLDALLAIRDVARAPRSRAGSDRAELPARSRARRCTTRRRARPRSCCARSRSRGSSSAVRCTSRRRRTSPTPSGLGDLIAAGIDDWGGVSPLTADHVNPERPWPALELLRGATEAAGKTLAPRLTVYPEYVRDPEQWLDPAVRFPVLCANDLEGSGPRRRLGQRWRHRAAHAAPAARPPHAPAVRSARCSTACATAKRSASTSSSRCSAHAVRSWRRSAKSPTSCGARSSATPSPSSATATSTTRTSARSSAGSARSRRARSR